MQFSLSFEFPFPPSLFDLVLVDDLELDDLVVGLLDADADDKNRLNIKA